MVQTFVKQKDVHYSRNFNEKFRLQYLKLYIDDRIARNMSFGDRGGRVYRLNNKLTFHRMILMMVNW